MNEIQVVILVLGIMSLALLTRVYALIKLNKDLIIRNQALSEVVARLNKDVETLSNKEDDVTPSKPDIV